MATHSSVLAWRIPGMGEPGGLPSMGSHRVGHDWSDLAAAAAGLTLDPCWLHPPECRPESCPGGWAGLQKVRVCSCFWPWKMASMERRMPTNLFMPSRCVRTNKKWVWKWRIWGQPCAMCNLITSHCPACTCVSAQSLGFIWLFETPWTVDHQAPLSCFCLLWRGCPGNTILKLDAVCGLVRRQLWF